jgi:hypothetical protein
MAGLRRVGDVPDAGITLKLRNRGALESVLKGQGVKADIDIIISAFNMAEAMYIINPALGEDWAAEIKEAQDAIFEMSRKAISTQRFVFNAQQMEAVKVGMSIHDVQLDEATVRELEQALDLIGKFIKSGKARVIDQKVSA